MFIEPNFSLKSVVPEALPYWKVVGLLETTAQQDEDAAAQLSLPREKAGDTPAEGADGSTWQPGEYQCSLGGEAVTLSLVVDKCSDEVAPMPTRIQEGVRIADVPHFPRRRHRTSVCLSSTPLPQASACGHGAPP